MIDLLFCFLFYVPIWTPVFSPSDKPRTSGTGIPYKHKPDNNYNPFHVTILLCLTVCTILFIFHANVFIKFLCGLFFLNANKDFF